MGEKEAKKRESAMFQKNTILLNEIYKLETIIKKMRCCGNCARDYSNAETEEEEVLCQNCIDYSNWKLKEE